MNKKQDRLKIIMQINDAAQLYKKYLVGKTFMYVFDNRYIEVMYKADNFRHLTGVDTDLSARDFYKLAQKKKLSTTQINFTSRHPYELCVRKVAHLKEIATLAYSESFMLEEIVTQTKSYKFGTTDLKFTLCLNKAYNHDGSEKGNCYIVESLRDEDCFSKSEDAFEVTHIFAKQNDTKRYSEHIFMASNSSMASLPQLVIDMLEDDLLETMFER